MGRELSDAKVEVRTATMVEVAGELTGETASTFVNAVHQAVGSAPTVSALVIDLRALKLLVASGVRPLMAAVEQCEAQGVRCCLVVVRDSAVEAVLDAAGIRAVLPMFSDVDQALTGGSVLRVSAASLDDAAVAEELSGQSRC